MKAFTSELITQIADKDAAIAVSRQEKEVWARQMQQMQKEIELLSRERDELRAHIIQDQA